METLAISPEEILGDEVAAYPQTSKWRSSPTVKEQRTVFNIHADDIPNHLTTTALAGRTKLAALPYVFIDDTKGTLNAFYYLGCGLAGHVGILHGGVIAVLLDECMDRACLGLLPKGLAVTANLSFDFKAPITLERVVLIRCETEKIEGRKAWVRAVVEDPGTGEVLVVARGLFIEPKKAEEMRKLM